MWSVLVSVAPACSLAPPELPVIATSSVINTLNYLLAPQRKAEEHGAGTVMIRANATRRLGAVLTAAALTVSLAACGGGENDSVAPPASTAPSGPPTSAPTTTAPSTPTEPPTRSTQKYGALTLVLDHTSKPAADSDLVLQAYDEYERSSNKSFATNIEDPALGRRTADPALQDVRSVLQDQKTKKVRTGGLITVTVKVGRLRPSVAALNSCYDQSKSVLVRADGTTYVGPGAKQYPRLKVAVVLTNVGGIWKVTEYNLKREAC